VVLGAAVLITTVLTSACSDLDETTSEGDTGTTSTTESASVANDDAPDTLQLFVWAEDNFEVAAYEQLVQLFTAATGTEVELEVVTP
jgi:ABC-type glycerol-3-phosphate transport system substrate-binding protein